MVVLQNSSKFDSLLLRTIKKVVRAHDVPNDSGINILTEERKVKDHFGSTIIVIKFAAMQKS